MGSSDAGTGMRWAKRAMTFRAGSLSLLGPLELRQTLRLSYPLGGLGQFTENETQADPARKPGAVEFGDERFLGGWG
ncbi:hypothetical protein SAMN05421770_103466 [Granulicella rosea]|uniref:Uncharacterized protein n=1 Tax=Granulicella rosea TaxID=474952 RepID=A0A239J6S7_9BACT|nr:hypothetical protein SAMN05421770_103466 [Granulicella rosea]